MNVELPGGNSCAGTVTAPVDRVHRGLARRCLGWRFLVGFVLALGVAANPAGAELPSVAAGTSGQQPIAGTPQGTSILLYDQFDGASGNGIPDQDFEVTLDAFDSMAADDFVVPLGATWIVDEVRSIGTTLVPGGAQVSVTMYANSEGGGNPDLPGPAIAGCTYMHLLPVDSGGSFAIVLPTPCLLPGGRYWVGIQTHQDLAVYGQHFWSVRGVQSGAEGVWRNPGNGFATGCTDFRPQTQCGVGGGASPDMLFQIRGVVAGADLEMTLDSMPKTPIAGQNLSYSAIAANLGPAVASNVVVSFSMPEFTTLISATPSSGGTCDAPSLGGNGMVICSWAANTLQGTANARSIAVVVGVPSSVAPGVALEATASVVAGSSDPMPANNLAIATAATATSADLAIAVTGSGTIVAGTPSSYVANVANYGPSDAQNLTIAMAIPSGVEVVSVTGPDGTCTNTSATVRCTWNSATAPGTGRQATVNVHVLASVASGSILTTAFSTESTTTDPVAGNNTAEVATVVSTFADVAVAIVDSPDPATAGDLLAYTITALNVGPSAASDVSVRLLVPGGVSLINATASAGGSCVGMAIVVCTWPGSTAPATERSSTVMLRVAPAASAGVTLSAAVDASSATADPSAENNHAIATTEVVALADLALSLSAAPPAVEIGEPIEVVSESSNVGPSDAQDVVIEVLLEADLRYASHVASTGGACLAPQAGVPGVVTCRWSGSTPPGMTRSIEIGAYGASAGASAVVAESSSEIADPDLGNNNAQVNVAVGEGAAAVPVFGQHGLLLLGVLLLGLGMAGLVPSDRLL